ncbi:MAG: small ribosomal subunit Rsm22 family protein [Rhodospirillales bacterium]
MPRAALRAAAARLTEGYRTTPDANATAIRDATDALAYAAVRMPATFAAVAAALDRAAGRTAGFAPATHLDVGSGPGTAALAAAAVWGGIAETTLVERDRHLAALGRDLLSAAGGADAVWRTDDLRASGDLGGPFDLVTAGYVLSEIPEAARDGLVDALWRATGGLLVIVDAGSRAGHARILAARDRLLARGAHLVGPCPHAGPCPLATGPDWCHAAVRLPRSRLHMQAKDVDRPYEDEPHAWLAVARTAPTGVVAGRVLRAPEVSKAGTVLTLCTPAGVERRTVPKRDKAAFRAAARLDWGDAVEG